MFSQQQIEAIILYHLYGESEAAAKRFRDAVTNAAKEIAAQQSVQRTCSTCGAKLRSGDIWWNECENCHSKIASG